jgi:hypothetical protein
MAHATTPVTTTRPTLVGLCGVTLPADSPSIRLQEMPTGGYIVAYDKHTWTAEQVAGLMRMHYGDIEIVTAAEAGA